MIEVFRNMGVIVWPMAASAAFLVFQIVRAVLAMRQTSEAAGAKNRHAVLVWGFLGALLGLLGTVLGLVVAARSVAAVGEVSPALLGSGLQVALTSTVFGLSLLTVAVLAWLVLPLVRPSQG